jgi:hypothetical protein
VTHRLVGLMEYRISPTYIFDKVIYCIYILFRTLMMPASVYPV